MTDPTPSTDALGGITHEEAQTSALRFINAHFRNQPDGSPTRERPVASIPANADRDTDLRLMAYLRAVPALVARTRELESEREGWAQQAYLATGSLTTTREAHAAEVAALRAEVARLREGATADESAHDKTQRKWRKLCDAVDAVVGDDVTDEEGLAEALPRVVAALRARLASTEAELVGLREAAKKVREGLVNACAATYDAVSTECERAAQELHLAAHASAALGARVIEAAREEGRAEERVYRVQQTTAWADERAAMKAERDEARRERDEAVLAADARLREFAADVLRACGLTIDGGAKVPVHEVAALRTERDAALAKLAEVSEAAEYVCERLMSGDTCCIEDAMRGTADVRSLLSLPAPTALAERDARVRKTALEEAADGMEDRARLPKVPDRRGRRRATRR